MNKYPHASFELAGIVLRPTIFTYYADQQNCHVSQWSDTCPTLPDPSSVLCIVARYGDRSWLSLEAVVLFNAIPYVVSVGKFCCTAWRDWPV